MYIYSQICQSIRTSVIIYIIHSNVIIQHQILHYYDHVEIIFSKYSFNYTINVINQF